MHKDKRQTEETAKRDLDHGITVAGPETRARENKGEDPRPAKTVREKGRQLRHSRTPKPDTRMQSERRALS